MNIVPITISIIIVALGIIVRQSEDSVITIKTPRAVTDMSQQSHSPTPHPSYTPMPTHRILTEPSNIPVPSTSDDWIYPGSGIISDGDRLTLSSDDDVDRITAWYEDKIRTLSMRIRTVVRTNTNGTLKNTLSASGNDTGVHLEIVRERGSDQTSITVSLD
jgi:hypothetical protein